MTDLATDRDLIEMLAEGAADRTMLGLELEAERDNANRLAGVARYLLAHLSEHDLAVLIVSSLPWFTIGDLVRGELARHDALRADIAEREARS